MAASIFVWAACSSAALAILAIASSPVSAAPRILVEPFPPGHQSCHIRTFDQAELAAHPQRRVSSIALQRAAGDVSIERKWAALEQFDDTPIVSAELRVRFRGDPPVHSARLACIEGDNGLLVCMTPNCVGGEIRIADQGHGAIAISIGGALASGQFIGHYIHLDQSCEGRTVGPIVLESGDDDRQFILEPAKEKACR